MVNQKRSLLAAAVLLALTATAPAHAVLERMGPINRTPTVGGYPAWLQDKSGITLEFCDLKTQAELDGGWCVALEGTVPEFFPINFGDEHFYYAADNDMRDAATGLRARLVIAMEAAFANGPAADGDQIIFGRHRVVIPNLPFDGDYRVITPFSDKTYPNMKVGDVIADTEDIGVGCMGTFECALQSRLGPFLLPSPVPGGAEVPPMPDLLQAPSGTDPFFDALRTTGGITADPQTGKKYLADPSRLGPVTGSPLPNFTAFETNGTTASRNHNTFRVEVRTPGDGMVFYTMEGESNFAISGRLMAGALPGKVAPTRAAYKADGVGSMTDLDVFATASPTTQARLPAQPQLPPVMPVLSYYEQPCANSVVIDPETGLQAINPPHLFSAPAGTPVPMAQTGNKFWGQTQPTGTPPSHVCIVDSAARDATGQAVPAYYLQRVTDSVTVTTATYDGPNNGTLSIMARSSDPTAKLTLVGYGPAAPETPGVATAAGPGTGLELVTEAATVTGVQAPPANVQISSSKGGVGTRETETARGMATGGGTGGGGGGGTNPPVIGTPIAVSEAASMSEDCSATTAIMCGAGLSLAVDLLGNDTVTVDGTAMTLRNFVRQGLGSATVTAQAPRLGLANITPDGLLSYIPNPNANGADSITYNVTVNGKVSNEAVLTINIAAVNDTPSAGSTSGGGVVGRAATLNLIANSSDPDGTADVRNAAILSWPTQLGAAPTPTDGIVNFTPTAAGTYNIVYQVRDAAGVLSPNTATGSVTVAAAETITTTLTQFTAAAMRWRINGTDTVRAGQTVTVVYADGKSKTGLVCDGISTAAHCVIGTATVDAAGGWTLDKIIAAGTAQDPTSVAYWQKAPTRVRAYSSQPVLGGSATSTILVR